MEVYRIKHIPTGLFYTPSRGSGNLSERGKAYAGRRPSLDWCRHTRVVLKNTAGNSRKARILIEHFNIQPSGRTNYKNEPVYWHDKSYHTPENEWVIETVE